MKEKKEIRMDRRKTIKLIETEEIYGVPAETVRKWIKREIADGVPPLRAFKPGKDILIYCDDFENYIKRFPAVSA